MNLNLAKEKTVPEIDENEAINIEPTDEIENKIDEKTRLKIPPDVLEYLETRVMKKHTWVEIVDEKLFCQVNLTTASVVYCFLLAGISCNNFSKMPCWDRSLNCFTHGFIFRHVKVYSGKGLGTSPCRPKYRRRTYPKACPYLPRVLISYILVLNFPYGWVIMQEAIFTFVRVPNWSKKVTKTQNWKIKVMKLRLRLKCTIPMTNL